MGSLFDKEIVHQGTIHGNQLRTDVVAEEQRG